MASKFVLPTDTTKQLANSTRLVYVAQLNKLAKSGYTTREEVLANPEGVVAAIRALCDPDGKDGDKQRHSKRVMLSAVFWILPPLPAENQFRAEFHKSKQNYIPPVCLLE